MSRQENSISDKSSSNSKIDIYEKAKSYWTQEIQSMLDSLVDEIKDINDWLLTSKEISPLIEQVTSKKGSIKSSFAFQLRKNFNDFKNMRKTRSHRDMAQNWRGVDSIAREESEQNPELNSISKQYTDEYLDINTTLFQRLQICVDRSGVEEKENPVSVINLCFSFRNSIDSLNLETKYEAALYRHFAGKILAELTPRYQKIDALLVKQGIVLDSKSAGSSSESTKQSSPKQGPVPKEFKAKSKGSKILSVQNSPASLDISRNLELLSLLHECKKNTQSASSQSSRVLADLKQQLTTLKIATIDKEVDHVSFLFNLIFRNKDLPDEIKTQLARLQIYVLMSAINETGFINQSDDPIHVFLDTVVEEEVKIFKSGRSEKIGDRVISNGINHLIESRAITSKNFTELLNQYQSHIDELNKQVEEERRQDQVKEARLKKDAEEQRLKKVKKEQQLRRIEEERLEKIEKEKQLKEAREEERLKRIEEDRLKKIEKEKQLKEAEEERLQRAEEERLDKIEKDKQLKEAREEERLKRIEEDRLKKIEKEKQLKEAEEERLQRAEEERLEKIEKDKQLKKAKEEERSKRIAKEKQLKKLREQERLKQIREDALRKQKRNKKLQVKADQTAKIKRLVNSKIEEITIPLLALNKSFILFDKVWSPLLLQIALNDGVRSSIWVRALRIVRNQVWSLIPKSTPNELQKLVAIRPHVANSLVRGMKSLKLSSGLQKSLAEYLRLELEEVIKQSNINIGASSPATNITKSTPDNDDSDETLIHNSEDLHYYDPNSDDSEDLVIEDYDDDTIIKGPENKIINDIEDFSASMITGTYQLSNEMLHALNSVVPAKNQAKSNITESNKVKKGDWVEFEQDGKQVMAKLIWKAVDNSLYIFVDSSGKRVKEIDGKILDKEIESGSIKLIENSSLTSKNSRFSVINPLS